MAMTQRSTRGYGKGFGDLNCPGDPGCPGYLDPSINQAIVNAMAQNAGAVAPAPASTPGWLQMASSASVAIYAVSAVLVLLAIAGGRR